VALQHAAEELKADWEHVQTAALQDVMTLEYASEDLDDAREIILTALSSQITGGALLYKLIPTNLCGDEDISLRLIDIYGNDLPLTLISCFTRKYCNIII